MDVNQTLAAHAAEGSGLRIDLGCGAAKRAGCIGFDCLDVPGVDHVLDLNADPWPLEDDSVDYIFSSHFLEHIELPGHIFNEIGRVCREGARIEIWTPYAFSNEAFVYTHVAWLTEEIWYHFCCHYPDVHAPMLKGRWLLRNVHYVVPAAVERDLAAHGFSVDFAIRYMKSVVKEFCVEIDYSHDLAIPTIAPRRSYSHTRDGERYDLDAGEQSVAPLNVGREIAELHAVIGRQESEAALRREIAELHAVIGRQESEAALRREIAELHAIIGRKDAHITGLEGLIKQIERGRLMRLLRVFNRT